MIPPIRRNQRSRIFEHVLGHPLSVYVDTWEEVRFGVNSGSIGVGRPVNCCKFRGIVMHTEHLGDFKTFWTALLEAELTTEDAEAVATAFGAIENPDYPQNVLIDFMLDYVPGMQDIWDSALSGKLLEEIHDKQRTLTGTHNSASLPIWHIADE